MDYIKLQIILLLRNMRYHRSWVQRHVRLKMLDVNATVNQLVESRCSLSRFGDGEFKQILSYLGKINVDANIGFQPFSSELGKRLYEVLQSSEPNHQVGLPSPFFGRESFRMKKASKTYWKNKHLEWFDMVWPLLQHNKTYCDSFFSRFYMDFASSAHCEAYINNVKRLWSERNLIIVEGVDTKLGVGNDLFTGARSIRRILCPGKNAFDRLPEIQSAVIKAVGEIGNAPLVLAALGPAATVLAFDLSKEGIQTIDIGHIDVEYEWFLRGATEKIQLPGRFVNEAKGEYIPDAPTDEAYSKEIIAKIV